MEKLPEKYKSSLAFFHNPEKGAKAIEIRRNMLDLPEVSKVLNNVERYIFVASTKKQIADIDDTTLVQKTGQMFGFIAKDVGYVIPANGNDWAYTCTRLLDILKKYFSQLTLSDIKLAFELTITGELDEYFQKGQGGKPDKNHYQQFNADYFAKVLNAYKRRQSEVIKKAYDAIPVETALTGITDEERKKYKEETRKRYKMFFLKYKYRGKVNFSLTDTIFIYKWLNSIGFADDVEITEKDRERAYTIFMKRVIQGFENRFDAIQVKKQGKKSEKLDFTASEVAREREILKAFDRMIIEEKQIDNYL